MKISLISLATLTVLAASTSHAQSPGSSPPGGGPGGGPEGRRPMPPLIRALDANGDGTIDASEISAAAAALSKLDKNRDGQLTVDEYRPQRPAGLGDGGPGGAGAAGGEAGGPGGEGRMMGKEPHRSPLVSALDADGDGTVSAAEIAAAPAALAKLDRNGDGQLTLDEVRPSRPDGGAGGWGGGEHHGHGGQ